MKKPAGFDQARPDFSFDLSEDGIDLRARLVDNDGAIRNINFHETVIDALAEMLQDARATALSQLTPPGCLTFKLVSGPNRHEVYTNEGEL